jgi:signal recognition particle subunit SRP54
LVGLGEALRSAISKFMGAPVADRQAIEELVRGIQRALLLSDVNVELVKKISDSVRKWAEEVKPPPGISRKDQIIKIVYEELIELLGGTAKKLEIRKKPYVLMVVGIQGSGKTTTIAKIAHYLLRNGYHPGIVCADTYRPAAYDQLVQLVGRVGIPVYGEPKNEDAVTIALRGVEEMRITNAGDGGAAGED